MSERIPIDAATRGRLRLWKAELVEHYDTINRLRNGSRFKNDVTAFCVRGSDRGRERAFARVNRSLIEVGAVLEGVRYGAHPLAAWAVLCARERLMAKGGGPADAQDCIAVNYVIAGSCEKGTCHSADGFWTLEVRDHALGRLLSRQTGDPSAAILEAHHAALRLRSDDIIRAGEIDPGFTFYLPAGPGAFACSAIIARDISTKLQFSVAIHCHTWLSDDQLRDAQAKLINDGQPGQRLGDSWLLPADLREVFVSRDRVATVIAWAPGMPEPRARGEGRGNLP